MKNYNSIKDWQLIQPWEHFSCWLRTYLFPPLSHLLSVAALSIPSLVLWPITWDKSASLKQSVPRWLFLSLSLWVEQWISQTRFSHKLLRGRLCHVERIWSAESLYWSTLSSWTRDRSDWVPGQTRCADCVRGPTYLQKTTQLNPYDSSTALKTWIIIMFLPKGKDAVDKASPPFLVMWYRHTRCADVCPNPSVTQPGTSDNWSLCM